ncbi:hypothetical protein Q8F55_001974 [Vanrija albida]|uniref:Peptidase M20 dimerisation domain-containing protein n=1 Tax=Vanrija albida TaxID=181172 RepID=A0ABR3Q8R5_9TREE
MAEKALPQAGEELPHPVSAAPKAKGKLWFKVLVTLVATGYIASLASSHLSRISSTVAAEKVREATWTHAIPDDVKCPTQPKALYPPKKIEWTDELRSSSIKLFQEAVQIPTESFDDNGEPDEDPRWKPFFHFQKWLGSAFPTAWKSAKIEFINTLGILATFEGSDPSLKPLLLMSHYDVTPAPPNTFDRWTHPPFSGHNDGEFIWGRGAGDDKTLLVAQWEAITYLLESGFKPRRTLILSHGFDEEEVFARRGQGRIAPYLEKRYGKDGLLLVIDEGAGTTDDFYGTPFALPALGEKGYLDIVIEVGTDGGHSSVPPRHTGIGIISQIVNTLEDHPFQPKLTTKSPILTSLFCASEHSTNFPKKWTKLLAKGQKGWDKLADEFADNKGGRAQIGTTIAVDVINGGVKVNALPELVTAQVNFRIDFDESVSSTQEHVARLVERIAKKHDLKFEAWGDNNATIGSHYVKLKTLGIPLEPAPRTPSSGGVWELFAGTVKASLPAADGSELVVAPFASTGNTDCKMYYNLTKNVYRFVGLSAGSSFGAHTVNERSSIKGHHAVVNWVHAIIQNADAYEGAE